ncbi:hypothetical protein IHE44_0011976 [Lamprotornis superbus]|uniref:Neurotrophin-3 n=1 Tax=Lamprotornis superbus TaxID=245042 RepID=A0A835NVF7_9PASS|nr:hypothetical protein IHE44_0011976 [Lamprotornis superbus]
MVGSFPYFLVTHCEQILQVNKVMSILFYVIFLAYLRGIQSSNMDQRSLPEDSINSLIIKLIQADILKNKLSKQMVDIKENYQNTVQKTDTQQDMDGEENVKSDFQPVISVDTDLLRQQRRYNSPRVLLSDNTPLEPPPLYLMEDYIGNSVVLNRTSRRKRYAEHRGHRGEYSVCDSESLWVTDKSSAIDIRGHQVTVLGEIKTGNSPVKQYFYETRCKEAKPVKNGCRGIDDKHWNSQCKTSQTYVRALTSENNKLENNERKCYPLDLIQLPLKSMGKKKLKSHLLQWKLDQAPTDGRMTKQAQMWCKKTKQYEDNKKLSRESRPLATTVGPCSSGQTVTQGAVTLSNISAPEELPCRFHLLQDGSGNVDFPTSAPLPFVSSFSLATLRAVLKKSISAQAWDPLHFLALKIILSETQIWERKDGLDLIEVNHGLMALARSHTTVCCELKEVKLPLGLRWHWEKLAALEEVNKHGLLLFDLFTDVLGDVRDHPVNQNAEEHHQVLQAQQQTDQAQGEFKGVKKEGTIYLHMKPSLEKRKMNISQAQGTSWEIKQLKAGYSGKSGTWQTSPGASKQDVSITDTQPTSDEGKSPNHLLPLLSGLSRKEAKGSEPAPEFHNTWCHICSTSSSLVPQTKTLKDKQHPKKCLRRYLSSTKTHSTILQFFTYAAPHSEEEPFGHSSINFIEDEDHHKVNDDSSGSHCHSDIGPGCLDKAAAVVIRYTMTPNTAENVSMTCKQMNTRFERTNFHFLSKYIDVTSKDIFWMGPPRFQQVAFVLLPLQPPLLLQDIQRAQIHQLQARQPRPLRQGTLAMVLLLGLSTALPGASIGNQHHGGGSVPRLRGGRARRLPGQAPAVVATSTLPNKRGQGHFDDPGGCLLDLVLLLHMEKTLSSMEKIFHFPYLVWNAGGGYTATVIGERLGEIAQRAAHCGVPTAAGALIFITALGLDNGQRPTKKIPRVYKNLPHSYSGQHWPGPLRRRATSHGPHWAAGKNIHKTSLDKNQEAKNPNCNSCPITELNEFTCDSRAGPDRAVYLLVLETRCWFSNSEMKSIQGKKTKQQEKTQLESQELSGRPTSYEICNTTVLAQSKLLRQSSGVLQSTQTPYSLQM